MFGVGWLTSHELSAVRYRSILAQALIESATFALTWLMEEILNQSIDRCPGLFQGVLDCFPCLVQDFWHEDHLPTTHDT